MATIKLGSPTDLKGITIKPAKILFNGNNVEILKHKNTTMWEATSVWFNYGYFNTEIFGVPQFYYQNYPPNTETYQNDGYIYFPSAATYGDNVMYTQNTVPKGKYKRVAVTYTLYEQNTTWNGKYVFSFGLTNTKNNDADMTAKTYYAGSFTADGQMKTAYFDLTNYNNSTNNLYFYISGVARVKIHHVAFLTK